MKYLILLILLALVFFLLGVKRARPTARKPEPDAKPANSANSANSAKPATPTEPRQMLSCAHCGLHLPADEALPGRGGSFCSVAHRSAYETGSGGGA